MSASKSRLQRLRSSAWLQWTGKTFFVLVGAVAQRLDNPYLLAPLPAALVLVGVVAFNRQRKIDKSIASMAKGIAEFGADYGIGAGCAIVAVNFTDWQRWMAFTTFFIMAILIISLGDFVKAGASGELNLSTATAMEVREASQVG